MSLVTKGIYIVAAKRTPFGKLGGMYLKKDALELAVVAAKAAITDAGLTPEIIDSVVIGTVLTLASRNGAFLHRHLGLYCGIPLERTGLAVNKACGTGFQSIINGAQSIIIGDSKIVLTGGAENMSQVPFAAYNVRYGANFTRDYKLEDILLDLDNHCGLSAVATADALAAKYRITRDDVDQFALRSQRLWNAANEAGHFGTEIAPVPLKLKKLMVDVVVDETPRPATKIDDLAKLPPRGQKNGLVTAGSVSEMADGAGIIILASEEAVKSEGLIPLARLVGYSNVGVEPNLTGIGAAEAIKKLLKITGKTLDDIEIVEINEAFAAETLACVKDLGLDIEKLNANGGAIAMGHPVAASGARITAHIVHELKRRNAGKFAIGSTSIGCGQGIALMIEAV